MHGINTPESFNMLKIISVGQEENNLQNQNVAVVWFQITLLSSDAVNGWAGWALDHLESGVSVNSIPKEGRLCQPYYCLPTRVWKPNGIPEFSRQKRALIFNSVQ